MLMCFIINKSVWFDIFICMYFNIEMKYFEKNLFKVLIYSYFIIFNLF